MNLTPPQRHASYSPEVQRLLQISGKGADLDTWLTTAEASVEFLKENAQAEWVVLFASLAHVLIECVLAPLKQIKKPDQDELARSFVQPDACWGFSHVSGGGRPDRVYLAPPIGEDCPPLKGGEKLVFLRSWAGPTRSSAEISQRLVHALGLHYVDHRNAYCRLNELGDLEDIIRVFDLPAEGFGESVLIVTTRRQEFYEYAGLAGMGAVFFYDFTRTCPGSFSGWSNQTTFSCKEPHLFYHGGIQPGAGSYVNGRQIILPPVTKREIVKRYKERCNPQKQRYAIFKAVDIKTGNNIEVSCNPTKLSNYFQPESNLPLQTCPAFFRPDVLLKYKSDPSKYRLEDRTISCRGAWHLQTYDVNEENQVHTYLRYLAYLPYQEQLYWQSFNEWPKAFISRRAFRTDFEGAWETEYDPIRSLKHRVGHLNKVSPEWWEPRASEVMNAVHCPVTESDAEWAEAILSLDQLVVEGFQDKPLKRIALEMGRSLKDEWRSLKLMEECLIGKGVPEDLAKTAVGDLRAIRELRSTVKGHAMPRKKEAAAGRARNEHGDFGAHFRKLASDCDDALNLIIRNMLQESDQMR